MIALYFKGYTLCDGCSNGVHLKHVNVGNGCQCDLCEPPKEAA